VELLEQIRDLKPDVAGIVLTGSTDPPALDSPSNRRGVSLPEKALAAGRHPGGGASSQRATSTRPGAIRRSSGCLRRGPTSGRKPVCRSEARSPTAPPRALGTMGKLAAGWCTTCEISWSASVNVESVLEQRRVA